MPPPRHHRSPPPHHQLRYPHPTPQPFAPSPRAPSPVLPCHGSANAPARDVSHAPPPSRSRIENRARRRTRRVRTIDAGVEGKWGGSEERGNARHDPHVQPLPFLLPFRTFCCSCCRDLSTSCFRPRLTALVFVHHGRAKVRSGFPPLRLSPPRRAFPRFPTLIRNSFVAIPFRRDSIFFFLFLSSRSSNESGTRDSRKGCFLGYRVLELKFVFLLFFFFFLQTERILILTESSFKTERTEDVEPRRNSRSIFHSWNLDRISISIVSGQYG